MNKDYEEHNEMLLYIHIHRDSGVSHVVKQPPVRLSGEGQGW